MVQFRFLSGRNAGQLILANRFPWTLGRSPASDLSLEEEGVWDRHLEMDLNHAEGFILTLHPPAVATINGQPFDRVVLHNGDLIEIGSVKMQFWLSEARLYDWRWRERLTWLSLALLCLGQVALIYWLTAS